MADREKKIANTIRTRFNIGSINKEFTQTAIRQLVRDGKLSPDDTLGKFFPDYPQARAALPRCSSCCRIAAAWPISSAHQQGGEGSLRFERRLLHVRQQPAADLLARRAQSILQRLLHRARRDRREGVGHAV